MAKFNCHSICDEGKWLREVVLNVFLSEALATMNKLIDLTDAPSEDKDPN